MRLHHLVLALIIHGATAGIVRKPPAFAKPVYSDSYLPASMQVIFHIVEQLKNLKAEELLENVLLVSSTSPHPPGQQQPLPTVSTTSVAEETETTTVSDEEKHYDPPEKYQEEALIFVKNETNTENAKDYANAPEVNYGIPEIVYGEPEKNHELPEINEEIPERVHVADTEGNGDSLTSDVGSNESVGKEGTKETGDETTDNETRNRINCMQSDSKIVDASYGDNNRSAVDNVLREIYSLVKRASLLESNTTSESSASEECIEGKNSPEESAEDDDRIDDLEDEKRFTLLGERVVQVPRPSLSAILRGADLPLSTSLRELGVLYDALSKDARKQGFSKFAGYSETVLESLQTTAGGGAGPQLKALLEKMIENDELTRNDSILKTKQVIAELNDPSSSLSTDLRRLLPLRFMA